MSFDEAGIRAFKATQGVSGAVTRVRAHVRQRAALAVTLWSAAALGVALAAAWMLAGSDGWKQGSPVPLLLDAVLVSLAAALAVWLRRGDRTWLAEQRVARAMEMSAGLAAGTIEGALQLARDVPAGVSGSLAALAERSVAGQLTLPPDRLAGALGARARDWIRRGGAALALMAPVVVLLAVSSPDRSLDAWTGLGRPIRALSRATLPALAVSPGNVEVLRGSAISVRVSAPGRTEVTLEWRAEGDVARTATVATEGGEARFRFDEVSAAIEYSANTVDGAATPSYRILPVDPLLVSQISLELAFPPYTGRPAEAYDGDVPPLVVPAGTRFAISGRATRPLGEAGLEREQDGLSVPFETEGAGFVGSWMPRAGGRYAWRFRDRNDADAELVPSPLDVTVVADSAPAIRFAYPAVDTVLPLTLQQPLVIEMRDDYGVGALELVAYRVTSGGDRLPPVVQRTDLGGTRAALARPVMDLSDWGLLPGDMVRYFARAVDNAPSPSAAQTREYVLRMPAVSELRRNAQEELEEMAERLGALADRARRAGEETRDMEREAGARAQPQRSDPAAQAGRPPDPSLSGFEERERLRQALEAQAAMSEEARAAQEQVAAIAEALREAGASDPQLQKDLRDLQALLQELSSPEREARLEEMAENLEGTDAREARETLEELGEQQARFREQLQRSLERLRRAAVEQDFRATAADALELSQREKALADALREGGQLQLREQQQEELRDQARALQERMERLEQRLAEIQEGAALAGVQQAQAETEEGEEAMEQARGALEEQAQGNQSPQAQQRPNQQAAQQAARASAAMERAASQLQQAQQQMSSERRAALERLLQQVGADALALARRQSEIRREVQSARGDAVAQLRGDESALLQGLRGLAESLNVPGAEAQQLTEAITQLGTAMEAVEQTMASLDTRRAGQPGPENAAEAAVQELNRLAITVMAAGQPDGEGGDPGDGGDVSDQLDALAQEQGELNNLASALMSMQLGEQAMQEQMEQMASAQEGVANRLQEVAEQPGAEGEALGDLDALAEEARQLAEQLGGGRLDADTRARQERLFHRLLDAGRTLENDDVTDERQSTTAPAFERGELLPLGPDALGVLKYGLPAAEQLQRLSPAERELVLRYFDRLNRALPPPPPVRGPAAPVEPEPEPAPDTGGRP